MDDFVPLLRPHQLGWLRRPELDTGKIEVWELPNGRLYAAEKGKELLLQRWSMKNFPLIEDEPES